MLQLDLVLYFVFFAAALGDIDVTRLDELEASLAAAQFELESSNIDVRYQAIMLARDEQYYYKNQFLNDFDALRKDVENIELINATIPRTCFSQIELEPVEKPETRF